MMPKFDWSFSLFCLTVGKNLTVKYDLMRIALQVMDFQVYGPGAGWNSASSATRSCMEGGWVVDISISCHTCTIGNKYVAEHLIFQALGNFGLLKSCSMVWWLSMIINHCFQDVEMKILYDPLGEFQAKRANGSDKPIWCETHLNCWPDVWSIGEQ